MTVEQRKLTMTSLTNDILDMVPSTIRNGEVSLVLINVVRTLVATETRGMAGATVA